jgi:XTP/dITP diphosphohydrolase
MCLCLPSGRTLMAEGRLAGRIAQAPAGQRGFGYDPVFLLPQRGLTVAQLPPEEKNAISHRGRALRRLAAELDSFLESAG